MAGEGGAVRDFMGGRMFAIHFRSPDLYRVIPHPRAWMYWTVNSDRRAFMASVNGRDQFNFHTQLKPGESEQISDAEARRCSSKAFAAPLDIEIIARSAWNAGYTWWRRSSSAGRISWRRRRAVCSRPAGGLATTPRPRMRSISAGAQRRATGWGGPALPRQATRPSGMAIARRNTTYARGFADFAPDCFVPPPELERTWTGRGGGAQAHRRTLQPPRPV